MKSQENLFTTLLASINIAVFEFHSVKQGFSLLGSPPSWIAQVLPKTEIQKATIHLTQHLKFLEPFLEDALLHWDSHSSEELHSGVWQEGRSANQQFEATALSLGTHKLLLIQQLNFAHVEWQKVLQQARSQTLSHNKEIKKQQIAQVDLGRQLDKSENLNQDLIAVLDQLHIGTIIVNSSGNISFINKAGEDFVGDAWKHQRDVSWMNLLLLKPRELSALAQMGEQVPERRETISVQFPKKKGSPYSVEIDIKNDPRIPHQQIWYVYDRTEVHQLRQLLDKKNQFHDMVGKSKTMQIVFQRIQEVGKVDAAVLIHGETGTGKELVARALHNLSPRHTRPFIAVNCAGLTDSLLGSQLFGHKRGAFTGAFEDHQGFFESAHGGTIFLDEIGDMPLPVQASLLRVLQEKEIIRLGESKPRKVDIRIVAASNQNLPDLVSSGKFRNDLLYRIRVARIDLPPLRERREDIPSLASLFLTQGNTESRKQVDDIQTEAMQRLLRYDWPGNVRELKSAIDFAVIHCPTHGIRATDLPPELLESKSAVRYPSTHERDTILNTLEQVKGNRAAAAKLLGISRATFYRRLSELEIVPD